jgi:diketogulonate reductase-like aldo/keto reductase
MGTYYDPIWITVAILFRAKMHTKRLLEALNTGLDNGMNFIDTAEIYQSESIVSKAIQGRKRDEIFLASKVWPNHLKPESLIKACKRSLGRLNTSYLDLYQIHAPSSSVPIEQSIHAMEQLLKDGLIRAVGVSNFSYSQMLEAEQSFASHELSSTQMNYNILHRDVESEILPHCEKEKISMIPYYPIAHGKLAKQGGSIKDVAMKLGKTTTQISLGWLVKRSEMNFPIPRASRAAHVLEDANAGDFDLPDGDFAALGKAYPLRA